MKYPILIIVPHGGCQTPEELEGVSLPNEFDLFMEADACANDIFSFDRFTSFPRVDTYVSRLFVDVDRPLNAMPPSSPDGAMKSRIRSGKKIYEDDAFPSEVAISNILGRYYLPFHENIAAPIAQGNVRLILECHTVLPVAPSWAKDAESPRPIITIEHRTRYGGRFIDTAAKNAARELAQSIASSIGTIEGSVAGDWIVDSSDSEGYIMKRYGSRGIPMMKISISRAAFINERDFNWEFMRADEIKLGELRNSIWRGIEKFFRENF